MMYAYISMNTYVTLAKKKTEKLQTLEREVERSGDERTFGKRRREKERKKE